MRNENQFLDTLEFLSHGLLGDPLCAQTDPKSKGQPSSYPAAHRETSSDSQTLQLSIRLQNRRSRVQQTSPGPVSHTSCTATPHEASTSSQRSSPGPASPRLARHSQNTGKTTALPSQPAVAAELLPVDSVYPSQPGLLLPRLRI
ncbi:hypothetical protein ElyMa_001992200 [Elysia marginata]|uniref:Uncharacterized protein n=1 Tax=Elysia marginata TaxID=1093978 RepID=A0AAV4F344_9GAST|nr:hypothetical protein ElyMa_001992200 [Elysia marginata]